MRISDWSSDVCSSDLISFVPWVQIAHDPCALDGRRMRVCKQSLAQIGLAVIAAPHLRPAQIETLIPRKAVNEGRFLALQRSEEHTSELQSLMRTSYAVFCLKKKQYKQEQTTLRTQH